MSNKTMAQTKQKPISFGGFYTRVRDYLQEKTALFGLIRWEVVVCSTQLDDDLILKIETTQIPNVVYINGEEYKLQKINL